MQRGFQSPLPCKLDETAAMVRISCSASSTATTLLHPSYGFQMWSVQTPGSPAAQPPSRPCIDHLCRSASAVNFSVLSSQLSALSSQQSLIKNVWYRWLGFAISARPAASMFQGPGAPWQQHMGVRPGFSRGILTLRTSIRVRISKLESSTHAARTQHAHSTHAERTQRNVCSYVRQSAHTLDVISNSRRNGRPHVRRICRRRG